MKITSLIYVGRELIPVFLRKPLPEFTKCSIEKLKQKALEQQFQIKLRSRFQILYDLSTSQEDIMNMPLSFFHGNITGMI